MYTNCYKQSAVNWAAIETILFDMDGTLLDLHFDNYFWLEHIPQAYLKRHQLHNLEAAKQITSARIMDKKGSLDWYCLDYWAHDLSLDIMALKVEIQHKIALLPHALDFLQFAQRLGKKLVLATNAHPKGLELKLAKVPIAPYFSNIVSSHDYGYAKEDQAFWSCLQAEIKFDPNTTLFIDDSLAVQAAAKEYGIAQQVLVLKPDTQRDTISVSANVKKQYICIENLREIKQCG